MTKAQPSPANTAGKLPSLMSLKSTLCLAGREAGFLANKLTELDRKIGESIENPGIASTHSLQLADEIRQGAEGLAHYLEGLSETLSAEILCDPFQATGRLALRGQIRRLLDISCETGGTSEDTELWSDHSDS